MGNRCRAMLAALAAWMLVSSGVAAWAHGLGARPGTPEERAYVARVYFQVQDVSPDAVARARVESEGRFTSRAGAALPADWPTAVDNSTLPWFPPIGDQGDQNSCVGWAIGYYYDTYTQAMDEGTDVSQGDLGNTCSPAFLYPLLNDGVDGGAYLDYAMARLSVIGCSSLALAPYRETDYTTWPSEAAWVDALSRRTKGSYRISGRTSDGLEAAKQLLANGRLALVMVDMYANLYFDYPHAPGVDSDVLYAPDGPYLTSHVVTLVGYDDTKTYLDQRDGQIHTGAFLAANSWGASWGVANSKGAGGFLWIAYDAFTEGRFVYDILYTDDRPSYRPKVYALVGLDAAQRGSVDLSGGAGLPSDADAVTDPVLHHSGGMELGISSSQRIAVDMTDVVTPLSGDRLADLFITLSISAQASSSGNVATTAFLADFDGNGTYTEFPAPRLPVTVATGATGYAFLPLFDDLDWDHWAYKDIETCYDSGIVSGYADGTYQPSLPVTRDQMAVYISRAMAGGDAAVPSGPAAAAFTDVPISFWAFRYVEYAAARGVVQGYRDGSYQPAQAVDRGTMAVYVARAMAGGDSAVPDPGCTDPVFPDVPCDFWSRKYIQYIQQAGVTTGYPDGLYHPECVVTRDLMAAYIARAFKLGA